MQSSKSHRPHPERGWHLRSPCGGSLQLQRGPRGGIVPSRRSPAALLAGLGSHRSLTHGGPMAPRRFSHNLRAFRPWFSADGQTAPQILSHLQGAKPPSRVATMVSGASPTRGNFTVCSRRGGQDGGFLAFQRRAPCVAEAVSTDSRRTICKLEDASSEIS